MTAAESFDVIRHTLAQAKTNYCGLYQFWLLFSGINLLAAVLAYKGELLVNPTLDAAESILTPLLRTASFLMIFLRERRISNKYYVGSLALWGIPALAIPVFSLFIRLGLLVFASDNTSNAEALRRLSDNRFAANMLLLCFGCILCAFVLNRKSLALAGLGVLLSYWILDILTNAGLLSIQVVLPGGHTAAVSVSALFYHLCMVFGYLAAALVLRTSIKRSCDHSNGSE